MNMKPSFDCIPHYYTLHNDTRMDPYPIQKYTPVIKQHIKKEHAYTTHRLQPFEALQEKIQSEIASHEPLSTISVPIQTGSWWYCTTTDNKHNYPIHYRFPITTDFPSQCDTLPDDAIMYLDENKEAEQYEYYSVSAVKPSPDEKMFAIVVDTLGTERYTVSFCFFSGSVDTGIQLPFETFHVEEIEWMNDSRHLFYTRLDDKQRPFQLWRHTMGTFYETDELLYEETDELFSIGISRSRNQRVLLIHSKSSSSSTVYYTSLDKCMPAQCIHPLQHGISSTWNQYTIDHDTYWLQVTNAGAVEFQCIVSEIQEGEETEKELLQWFILLPESSERLNHVEVFDTMVVWEVRHNGNASVRYAPWESLEQSVLLHDSVSSIVLRIDQLSFYSPCFRICMSSFITPEHIIDVYKSNQMIRSIQYIRHYHSLRYETKKIMVPSDDGTPIPVSIVYKKPSRFPRPMVLYGYGSYEICIDQKFSISRLSLLDRGVMYAMVHVRGGGECGRMWYEKGRLQYKENTFCDFIAATTYLIEKGWTTPEQLVLRGGSAGGMLMGTVMNRAPHLCKAVVAEVPFVDVLTTMLDSTLPLTIEEREEWGDPQTSHVYHRIKRYSPYDNIIPMKYPNVYVTGALHDTRVRFYEPLKWTLRLRDAHPENQVYIWIKDGGHTGPTSKNKKYREESAIVTFILTELGIEK